MLNIQDYYHQENIPETIIRDSRGTLIEEGLRVAYNYGGAVAIGTIVSYKCLWKIARPGVAPKNWWYCKFELKVRNEDGHISTVKNPNSFVII